jgi:hypothetical protein
MGRPAAAIVTRRHCGTSRSASAVMEVEEAAVAVVAVVAVYRCIHDYAAPTTAEVTE